MSGAVPDSLKIVELGDVGTFLSGGTPSKEREDYWGGAIPWVTARDLKRTFLQDAGLTLTELGASGVRMAPAGAIFLLVRGMTLFKDFPVSVALRDMAFNQDIKALVVDKAYNSQYVAYQLVALKKHVMALVDSAGHGTGRLDTDALKGLPLKFPSLPEKTKIAEFLGVVDAKLTALRRKKGGLETFKSGLMQQLFTQTLRFTRDDGTKFPDWEERRMEDVFAEVKERVGDDSFPTYSISAGRGFVSQEERFGRDISGEQNERYTVLKPGEFSYNKGNSISYNFGCIYENQTGCTIAVPNVFISFRLRNKDMSGVFFGKLFEDHHLDKGLRTLISSGARMNGLLNVNKDAFFKLTIPVPHPDEQRKIADALSALDAKISAVGEQIAQMQTFKQGLLQQMFV